MGELVSVGTGSALGMVPRVMIRQETSWMGSNTAKASGTTAPLDSTGKQDVIGLGQLFFDV